MSVDRPRSVRCKVILGISTSVPEVRFCGKARISASGEIGCDKRKAVVGLCRGMRRVRHLADQITVSRAFSFFAIMDLEHRRGDAGVHPEADLRCSGVFGWNQPRSSHSPVAQYRGPQLVAFKVAFHSQS